MFLSVILRIKKKNLQNFDVKITEYKQGHAKEIKTFGYFFGRSVLTFYPIQDSAKARFIHIWEEYGGYAAFSQSIGCYDGYCGEVFSIKEEEYCNCID